MHSFSKKEFQQLLTSPMGHWGFNLCQWKLFLLGLWKAFTHLYKTHLGVSSSRPVNVAEATTKKSRALMATVKKTKEKRRQNTVLQEHIMLERSRTWQKKPQKTQKTHPNWPSCKYKKSLAPTYFLGWSWGGTSQMQFQGQRRTTVRVQGGKSQSLPRLTHRRTQHPS